MLAGVAGVIDGRKWLQERLQSLQVQLDAEPSEDQRQVLEAEIQKVRAELGAGTRRLRRWLLWGARPPTS
jgi:hypothetical protein